MKQRLFIFLGILATSLWSIASATSVTYNLNTGGSGTTINTGGYNAGGADPFTIYGENISGNGTSSNPGCTGVGCTVDDGGPGTIQSQLKLFSVTQGMGSNNAGGIAPYISTEGGYTSQLGITEYNILLVNLSQITTPGSTVTFVLQQSPNLSDGYNVYTGTATTSHPVTGITKSGGPSEGANALLEVPSLTGVTIPNSGIQSPTTNISSFTLSNLTSNEWVAIQADCHYLLLDSISVYTPAVPEPSFYGFIALAMVGLVLGARKMRARAAVAAAEQA